MYPFHSKKLQDKGKTEMPVCFIDFRRSFRNMMIGGLNSNVAPKQRTNLTRGLRRATEA
jgi:hypothetical protein